MAHYSPLRYPGGKGKMYKQTLEILQKNNLIDVVTRKIIYSISFNLSFDT